MNCNICGKEIDANNAFSFGGGLACETCVREYYTQQDNTLPIPSPRFYSPETIAEELRMRKREAVRVLKQLERGNGDRNIGCDI